MLYGVHIGHSFKNSVFYTAWLVYTYSQQILILNLFKTLKGMRSGLASLVGTTNSYNPVWFINLDQAAGITVRFTAMSCGEFSATSFWINGFIANYNSVYNTYRKLRKMSFFSYPGRNKNAVDSYNIWYLTRLTWPRTTFISNVSFSYQAAIESQQLGIPCIGIVDSNTYTHVTSIPIPGNDDSIDCLVFYNDFISKFILLKKYILIITWYYNIRSNKRLFKFKDWFKDKFIKKKEFLINKKLKVLDNIKYRFNPLKNIQLGMNVLFSQNSKYLLKNFEYLDIYKDGIIDRSYYDNEDVGYYLIKKTKHFIKELLDIRNILYAKKLWSIYKAIRHKYLKSNYFRANLLTQNYFRTNIKIDRFYKTHIRYKHINSFISKFYKFYVIYNFSKVKQLSTKKILHNYFETLYLKLVINQFIPKSDNIEVNFTNKIKKKLCI